MDLFLTLVAATSAGALGFLGAIVTLFPQQGKKYPKRYLLAIGALTMVAIGCVLWQQVRNSAQHDADMRRIESFQAGGDSYCYIDLSNRQSGTASLTIMHMGEYPLYDVTARVVFLNEAPAGPGLVVPIGNLSPGLSYTNLRTVTLDHGVQALNVFFTARNGCWHQATRLAAIGPAWSRALRVWRDDPNGAERLLFEEIDSNYPRDADGQVAW